MEQYIGTKMIMAEPAIKKGGKVYLLTWPIPKSMEPAEDGYKVVYKGGYESWSPKAEFEAAYRRTYGMTYGLAIDAMKMGCAVARLGWNIKGMFIYLVSGDSYPAKMPAIKGLFEYDMVPYRAYIAMKTAQGDVAPYTPTQCDSLAEDWVIIPPFNSI